MLVGRNAVMYRTISKVSIEELAELIDIKIIERIEDDTCVVSDTKIVNHEENDLRKFVSSETVRKYYIAINVIKQGRTTKIVDHAKYKVPDVDVNYINSKMAVNSIELSDNQKATDEVADGQSDHSLPPVLTEAKAEVKPKTRKPRKPKTKQEQGENDK